MCLAAAARCGSIATIDLLLKHGADKANSLALHFACDTSSRFESPPRSDEESIQVIRHLIDLGFDVNGSDAMMGRPRACGSPLMHAIRATSIPKIKCLLEHGADPRLSVDGRVTPYYVAESGGTWHVRKRELLPEILHLFQELPPS